jgi:uncharacterized paraquat-inducible protein A
MTVNTTNQAPPIPKPSRKEKYKFTMLTREAHKILQVTAVYANMHLSEVVAKLVKCPACDVLLVTEAPGSARCPRCGKAYRIEPV